MKASIIALITVLVSGGAFAATDRPVEKDVLINIHDVIVPAGFDSESDVVVIESGVFPNSCYRWNQATVQQDKAAGIYEVKSTARVSQGMCLMVMVPFNKEVNLGRLGQGEHHVRFINGDGTYIEKLIKIE